MEYLERNNISIEEIEALVENLGEVNDTTRIMVKNEIIDSYAKLSVTAQKIFLIILAQFEDRINMNAEHIMQPYAFRIMDIYPFLNGGISQKLGGKDYLQIENALNELMDVKIHPYSHKNNKEGKMFGFVVAPNVYMYGKQGIFVVQLNHSFYPYLYGTDENGRLKRNYTVMILKSIMKLHDRNSMKMYALLYSRFKMTVNKYKGTENGKGIEKSIISVPIPVQTIRSMLFGTAPTYEKFTEFRRNVLEKTIRNINKYTNMHVSIEDMIRKSKKVITIKFNVQLEEDENEIEYKQRQYYKDFQKKVKNSSHQISKEDFDAFEKTFSPYIALQMRVEYEHLRKNSMYFDLTEKLEHMSVVNEIDVTRAKKESYNLKMMELSKRINELRKEHYFAGIALWDSPTNEAIYDAYCEAYSKKQAYQLQIFEELRRKEEKEIMGF